MSGVLVLLPVLALIPALIAKRRGRGFWTFYVFGLLLWIVAVPVALFSKDKRRRCPHCMEVIHAQATACPHCQREVGGAVPAEEPPPVLPFAEPAGIPGPSMAQAESSTLVEPDKREPRNKRRIWIGAAALAILALVVGIAVSASIGGGSRGTSDASAAAATSASTPHKVAPHACSSFKNAKPRGCLSKTGFTCSSYGSAKPNDCYTAAQLRSRAAAKLAQAKAAARARAEAVAAAKAQAAAEAAANAWHQGYTQQDENVYWKWDNGKSCAAYTSNGCWHVEVITQDGCPSYVAVNANEYSNGSIINSLLDNQGYGIPAQTPRLFELDADQNGVTAGDVKIDCN